MCIWLLWPVSKTAAAWCAVVLGAVYLGLGECLRSRTGAGNASALRHLHLALGTGFITLAIAIRFESHWISIGWLVEAAALMTIGFCRRSSFVRWQALVLIAATIVKVFANDVWRLERGHRIASFILLGMLLLVISFVYQRDRLRRSVGERHATPRLRLTRGKAFLELVAGCRMMLIRQERPTDATRRLKRLAARRVETSEKRGTKRVSAKSGWARRS